MIRLVIDRIGIDPGSQQYVMVLKEEMAGRYLPIWIGPVEANAIALKLQGVQLPRPSSHDLLCSIIHRLGAKVDYVLVTGVEQSVFYAKIVLAVDVEQLEVESRPSDALALAVRAQTPIYAEEAVLEQAGIWLQEETGKPIPVEEPEGEAGEKQSKASQEELKRMSAFTDFINNLDLGDIGSNR